MKTFPFGKSFLNLEELLKLRGSRQVLKSLKNEIGIN